MTKRFKDPHQGYIDAYWKMRAWEKKSQRALAKVSHYRERCAYYSKKIAAAAKRGE